MSEPLYLYGAEPSYYTGKTRSYLRKKQIPFIERNASHPRHREVTAVVGRAIIPIIETPEGDIIQDTSEIFDRLETRYPDNPMLPSGPKQRLVSYLLELFGDEAMLKPAMHYRWNFPDDNFPFIFREFGRSMAPTMPMDESAEIAKGFAAKMQSYLPVLGITDASRPRIEDAFLELLDLLNEHFRHHPYVLGGAPSLGDFALIGPFYAHLFRDVHPSTVMKKHAPFVCRWVERMNVADDGMGEFGDRPRTWLDNDEVPATLLPVLRHFAEDFTPEIASIVQIVGNKTRDLPKGAPLRAEMGGGFGKHTVAYRGLELEQAVRPFAQWMLQRVLKSWQGLSDEERALATPMLEETGLLPLVTIQPDRWIARENYKEILA